jgi:hypothetical protein
MPPAPLDEPGHGCDLGGASADLDKVEKVQAELSEVEDVLADQHALGPGPGCREPSNGPEIMRAAGGASRSLIVFKVPAEGRIADEAADVAQGKLEAHGYGDFTRTAVLFAGQPGVALDFVTRNSKGDVIYRTREYFAVRGNAGYVLGMGGRTWEEHLPLIEAIAARFELTD